MSRKEITDQAGHPAMQAFWNSPIGKQWKKQDQEAAAKLKDKDIAVGMLLSVSNLKLKRFRVLKMDEATEDELQASRSLGIAVNDLQKVGQGFNDVELAELARIQTELEQLEDEFDTILVNKYE